MRNTKLVKPLLMPRKRIQLAVGLSQQNTEIIEMSSAHYPWKVYVLASWLVSEMDRQAKLSDQSDSSGASVLASKLQIPENTLWQWVWSNSESITFEQLQAIARYCSLNINQVAQWLGICSSHLEQLLQSSGVNLQGAQPAAVTKIPAGVG